MINTISDNINTHDCSSILKNSMRGYIRINFIKQWRNRTIPLMYVKFILIHQISNFFTYSKVTIGQRLRI